MQLEQEEGEDGEGDAHTYDTTAPAPPPPPPTFAPTVQHALASARSSRDSQCSEAGGRVTPVSFRAASSAAAAAANGCALAVIEGEGLGGEEGHEYSLTAAPHHTYPHPHLLPHPCQIGAAPGMMPTPAAPQLPPMTHQTLHGSARLRKRRSAGLADAPAQGPCTPGGEGGSGLARRRVSQAGDDSAAPALAHPNPAHGSRKGQAQGCVRLKMASPPPPLLKPKTCAVSAAVSASAGREQQGASKRRCGGSTLPVAPVLQPVVRPPRPSPRVLPPPAVPSLLMPVASPPPHPVAAHAGTAVAAQGVVGTTVAAATAQMARVESCPGLGTECPKADLVPAHVDTPHPGLELPTPAAAPAQDRRISLTTACSSTALRRRSTASIDDMLPALPPVARPAYDDDSAAQQLHDQHGLGQCGEEGEDMLRLTVPGMDAMQGMEGWIQSDMEALGSCMTDMQYASSDLLLFPVSSSAPMPDMGPVVPAELLPRPQPTPSPPPLLMAAPTMPLTPSEWSPTPPAHAHVMMARVFSAGVSSPAPPALPPLSGASLPPSQQPLSHMQAGGAPGTATATPYVPLSHPHPMGARRLSHGLCAAVANNSHNSSSSVAEETAGMGSPLAPFKEEPWGGSSLGAASPVKFDFHCGAALHHVSELGLMELEESVGGCATATVPSSSSSGHENSTSALGRSSCVTGVLEQWEAMVADGMNASLPHIEFETLEGVKASVVTAASDALAATAALTAVEEVLAARRADAERAHSAALAAARRMTDLMAQLAARHGQQLPSSFPETPAANNTAGGGRATPPPAAAAQAGGTATNTVAHGGAAADSDDASVKKEEGTPLMNNLHLVPHMDLGDMECGDMGDLGCMGLGSDFMGLGCDMDVGMGMDMDSMQFMV